MSASFACVELEVGQRAAEHRPRPRVRQRLVERAPREAERGGGDRRAKDVERAHRELEALALGAEQRVGRHAAAGELEARERMRRDHVDALGDRQARRVGRHDERRDAARAGRVARAREHAVEIGDAAVRDPRLAAVEHASRRRRARARVVIAATSEPASGSDSANAAIASPCATRGSQRAFCASLPASVIAPLPSPCIANAKSARPS